MKFIAHRGNINGKIIERENTSSYIDEAFSEGYEVEIDVHYIDGEWFLGHDKPSEKISFSFLKREGLWIHCKNIEALTQLHGEENINYFWHEEDDVALTSKGYMWVYPGKQPIPNSIAVLPEKFEDDISQALGVCTDYVKRYKEMWEN